MFNGNTLQKLSPLQTYQSVPPSVDCLLCYELSAALQQE